MCRLLAYASRTPVSLTDLLGADELDEFVQLSRTHCDGWGLAWAEDRGVVTTRVPDPAHESPEFVRVSQEHRSDLAIAHVRWATDGLDINLNNTHPFTNGTVGFAHNGAIRPATGLDALVPADLLAERQGTTDSERYFLAVLGRMRTMGPAEALADVANDIADGDFSFTCLNAMLVTDTQLIALNRFRPSAEAEEGGPEYYRLRYRIAADSVVVTSSGWGSGWQTLDNGQMLVVQRHTLETEILDVAPVPVG
jgi:predicted glutamine amidotransferase